MVEITFHIKPKPYNNNNAIEKKNIQNVEMYNEETSLLQRSDKNFFLLPYNLVDTWSCWWWNNKITEGGVVEEADILLDTSVNLTHRYFGDW